MSIATPANTVQNFLKKYFSSTINFSPVDDLSLKLTDLVCFYAISTIADNVIPYPFYKYIYI